MPEWGFELVRFTRDRRPIRPLAEGRPDLPDDQLRLSRHGPRGGALRPHEARHIYTRIMTPPRPLRRSCSRHSIAYAQSPSSRRRKHDLRRRLGGVHNSGVDVAELMEAEEAPPRGRVAKDVAGRLVDRDGPRASGRSGEVPA